MLAMTGGAAAAWETATVKPPVVNVADRAAAAFAAIVTATVPDPTPDIGLRLIQA